MEISKRTLEILQNFSRINNSIIIEPGNIVYTSKDGAVFAWAEIEEEIPHRVCVYSLMELLAIINKFGTTSCKVDFQENLVLIKSGRSRTKYKYTSHNILSKIFRTIDSIKQKGPPPGCIEIASISSRDIDNMKKVASTMNLDVVQLVLNGGTASLRCTKSIGKEENVHEVGLVKNLEMDDFIISIDINKFQVMIDSYDIYMSPKKAIIFYGRTNKVTYLLMADQDKSDFSNY